MDEGIVTIATLTYSGAQILKNLLDEANIECVLTDVNVIRSTAPAYVKVHVNENDSEEALRIALSFKDAYGETELHTDDIVEDINKILVPIDFSNFAQNACEYALGIAGQLKAEIMLFHAYYFNVMPLITASEPFTYQVGADQSLAEIKELAENNMKEFYVSLLKKIEELDIADKVRLKYSLHHGIPEEEVLSFCETYKPGVIIMGTRGHLEKDVFFGNVTTTIIEDAKVPVLAIPQISKYEGVNRTNILYATNFDKSDAKAIRKLMTLVYLFDVKLYCVHIGKHKWDSVFMENFQKHFEEHYAGYDFECVLLNGNDVVKELQQVIDEKNIDIIAMTTHKRNFLTRYFNPSLTKKMLFHTHTPLLVFHA
jgi:nucleotide-binding universal stress UspA family protein